MYDAYIIETRKGAAGIVVRDGHGFRFFAATQDFLTVASNNATRIDAVIEHHQQPPEQCRQKGHS